MDKIVGKIIISCFFIIYQCQATVTLRMLDLRGNQIDTIAVGKPCMLEVRMEQTDRQMRTPEISGLNQVRVTGRETNMHFFNGATTISYKYRVLADKPGFFTLGPAHVETEGVLEKSNTISIRVQENQEQEKSASEDTHKVFARLKIDKDRAVVGEKIQCQLRFYSLDPHISLQNIANPPLPDFEITDQKKPQSGSEYVHGNRYSYLEWNWDMYAKEPGKYSVPAYAIDFSVPSDEEHDRFSPFAIFFQRPMEKKRLYSNSVALKIDPLPAHSAPVHALGHFKYLAARIEPTHAKVGEGLVLTIDLEGEGDIESIEMPELHNIPDVFKWYDSKNYVSKSNQKDGYSRKTFEYIVQGLKPGEWQIPPQEFTFFDTKTRTYTTLKSEPLFVTLTLDAKTMSQATTHAQKVHEEPLPTMIDVQPVNHDLLAPLNHEGPWYFSHERKIPWDIFLIIIFLPLIFVAGKKIFSLLKKSSPSRKAAFEIARKSLRSAEQRHAHGQIYPIFMTLFATLLARKSNEISEEDIAHYTQLHNFTLEEQKNWNNFFANIAEFIFFSKDTQLSDDTLFDQASQWITKFERAP